MSSIKCYDVHIALEDDCKEGYSIFIQATSKVEAINTIVRNHLFEDPEDINTIDYIDEITEQEYLYACRA